MKHCGSCERNLDESEFGVRKASIDRLSANCKLCQKIYDKARANDPYRKMQREIYMQTEEGKLAGNKSKAKYRAANPIRRRAHEVVAYAIRRGNLFRQPCESCDKKETHAHHDDYAKPLNIRWLCALHHKQWHKDNGEGLNP